EASLSSSSSIYSSSSSQYMLGFKVEVIFDSLAIRHMWASSDDDEVFLETPFMAMTCPIKCLVFSTLLAIQQLEEIEAFLSWQQGISNISSKPVLEVFL